MNPIQIFGKKVGSINSREPDLKRMRSESGNIKNNDKLICFIYLLIRDHLPSGAVEEIAVSLKHVSDDFVYTNGWLAQYAEDIAKRLR